MVIEQMSHENKVMIYTGLVMFLILIYVILVKFILDINPGMIINVVVFFAIAIGSKHLAWTLIGDRW